MTGSSFAPAVDDRIDRKRRLAIACRVLSSFGIDEDVAGQVSVRDPDEPGTYWIPPYGQHFATVRVSDLVRVDGSCDLVEGTRLANSAAFGLDSAIHEARSDAVAVAHAHPVHGRAFSALARLLEPISQDACVFFEDHAVLQHFGGPMPTAGDRAEVVAAIAGCKALIHTNHGLTTVGGSVDAAVWWLIALERCCQAQLLVEATGASARLVAPEVARTTRHLVGTETAGWLRFQQHYERVLVEQPDVLR